MGRAPGPRHYRVSSSYTSDCSGLSGGRISIPATLGNHKHMYIVKFPANNTGHEGFKSQTKYTWRSRQIKTFSALLALCDGESTGHRWIPSQRPVTWNLDIFFDLRLNKRLSKTSKHRCFDTPSRSLWRHYNVLVGTFPPQWWTSWTNGFRIWNSGGAAGIQEQPYPRP